MPNLVIRESFISCNALLALLMLCHSLINHNWMGPSVLLNLLCDWVLIQTSWLHYIQLYYFVVDKLSCVILCIGLKTPILHAVGSQKSHHSALTDQWEFFFSFIVYFQAGSRGKHFVKCFLSCYKSFESFCHLSRLQESVSHNWNNQPHEVPLSVLSGRRKFHWKYRLCVCLGLLGIVAVLYVLLWYFCKSVWLSC